ncbi:MAG: hypothetical protein IH848_00480 [Acidobacteria bacterium]|nr:hypothetical protein [Acidobacteriota bacterium]
MLKFKVLLGSMVILGTLLFGVVTAHAWGWYWNAELDIDGNEVHTAWGVNDDADPKGYFANIHVYLPPNVPASVVTQARNEEVTFHEDNGLSCNRKGIPIVAVYDVQAKKKKAAAQVQTLAVFLFQGGTTLGFNIGVVGENLTVNGLIDDDGACFKDNHGKSKKS